VSGDHETMNTVYNFVEDDERLDFLRLKVGTYSFSTISVELKLQIATMIWPRRNDALAWR